VPREWESDDDVGLAQSELSDDLGCLLDYGRQHPDSYGAVRFVGARLEVSCTDPDTHRESVLTTVEHPDRVDVVRAPRTERALQGIRTAVEAVLALHPESWSGLGNAGDHLVLDLRPRGLQVAASLWQDHGDALEITVGGHRFPLDADAVAAELRWPGPEQSEPWPAGLVAQVHLEEPVTAAGAPVRGRLVLRATTEPVAFDSDQPLYGELLDDTGLRVNSFAGVRVGTGWSWRLQPGEQGEVEVSAGTDSSRLADGPVVGPGTWRLVVPVPVHRQTPNGPVTTQLVAGPFTVVLTEPRSGTG
jgi:hypothetical protein